MNPFLKNNAAKIINMNFTINIESYTLNKNSNFVRLIEQIRQCIREREILKEQQQQRRNLFNYSLY